MAQNYCSHCGSLLVDQISSCPSCGQVIKPNSNQSNKFSFTFNDFSIIVFIGSALLPILNQILLGFFLKFILKVPNNFDFTLFDSIEYLINFSVTIIFFIYLFAFSVFKQIKYPRGNYVDFTLKILIFSIIGSFIALIFNNFFLNPFINSLLSHSDSGHIILFIFKPFDLIIYLISYGVFLGISFALMSVFVLQLKEIQFSLKNFLPDRSSIWFILIGLLIGLAPNFVYPIFENFYRHATFIISFFLFYSYEFLMIVFIPLILAIVSFKIINFPLFKQIPINIIIIFLSVLFSSILVVVLFNSQNSALPGTQTPFLNSLIFFISSNLSTAFESTVNVFALIFLIQVIVLKQPLGQYKHNLDASNSIFNIKNPFRKRTTNTKASINIDSSLEKLESIIRENSED